MKVKDFGKILTARSFLKAYKLIHEEYIAAFENPLDSNTKVLNTDNVLLVIPAVVDCVFACEMFLKALLDDDIIDKLIQERKGHYLCNLFEKLDGDSKDRLSELTMSFYGRRHKGRGDNFYDDLALHSNTFVKWRYALSFSNNETGIDLSYNFIQAFAQALDKYINELTVKSTLD